MSRKRTLIWTWVWQPWPTRCGIYKQIGCWWQKCWGSWYSLLSCSSFSLLDCWASIWEGHSTCAVVFCKVFKGSVNGPLMCSKISSRRLLLFKGSSNLWVLQQSNSRCGIVKTTYGLKVYSDWKNCPSENKGQRESGDHVDDQWRRRDRCRSLHHHPPTFFLPPPP